MILLYILGGVIVYFMIGFLAVIVCNIFFYNSVDDYDKDVNLFLFWPFVFMFLFIAIPVIHTVEIAVNTGEYLRIRYNKWRGIVEIAVNTGEYLRIRYNKWRGIND